MAHIALAKFRMKARFEKQEEEVLAYLHQADVSRVNWRGS
jgi:hypothetical protein